MFMFVFILFSLDYYGRANARGADESQQPKPDVRCSISFPIHDANTKNADTLTVRLRSYPIGHCGLLFG